MTQQLTEKNALLSDPQMGEMLAHLSAEELRVLLYLTLQNQPRSVAVNPRAKVAFPLRKIASGTQLSKKKVRNALRLLSINASYYNRFQ